MRHRGGEHGGAALEYAVVMLLVAVLSGAIAATSIGSNVEELIRSAICAAFQLEDCDDPGGDGEAADDADYLPPRCEVYNTQDRAGYSMYILFFKFGEEYAFMEQQMADGTYRLTLMPHNVELGVEGKLFQVKTEGGDHVQLGAEAKIGGYLKAGIGDTWVFADREEAESFKDAIVENQMAIDSMARNPASGLYYWLNPPPEIPDPSITTATVRLEAGVNGEAGWNVKTSTATNYFDIGTGLRGKFRIGGQVATRVDNRDPDNPLYGTTYQVDGQLGFGGEILGGGQENLHDWSGAVRITRNEAGEPVEIVYVTTVEEAAVSKDRLGTGSGGSKGGSKLKDGESTVQETRTTITLDTPEERAVADRYLEEQGLTGMPAIAFSQLFDDGDSLLTEPPPGADEFERLLYEQATVSNTTQLKATDSQAYGGKVALGVGLGLKIYMDSSEAHTVESEYLQAPRQGTREFGEYPACLSEVQE